MTTTLYIGALAACTGLPRSTIRYYESIGLLTAATRTPSGYRVYSRKAVAELEFVRRSQALGFSLEDIRELLSLHRRGVSPCRRVIAIARQRLDQADQQLRELVRFRDYLAQEIDRWAACHRLAQDPDAPCALIECEECDDAARDVSPGAQHRP